MLAIEYLAGLDKEEKAGIEGRLLERAVLEPSSKVLEVLEVLVSALGNGEQPETLILVDSRTSLSKATMSWRGSHQLCIASTLVFSGFVLTRSTSRPECPAISVAQNIQRRNSLKPSL